jgi:hypothetical protein
MRTSLGTNSRAELLVEHRVPPVDDLQAARRVMVGRQ